MTMRSAEQDLLNILSTPLYCQRVNDGTIGNDGLDSRVSDRPGNTIGRQAGYYEGLAKTLQAQENTPAIALRIVKPSI